MRASLHIAIFVVLIALSSVSVSTKQNASYHHEHEYVNVLRKRQNNRILVGYCTEQERTQVEHHIREAEKILRKARDNLEALRHETQTTFPAPPRVRGKGDRLPSIYRTYQVLMNLHLFQPASLEDARRDREEFDRVIELLQALLWIFGGLDYGPVVAIHCSDEWLSVRGDGGHPPPKGGYLWDSRPVPRDQKINGGWFKVPGWKFKESDDRDYILTTNVPRGTTDNSHRIGTIITLNPYKFEGWLQIDESWENYDAILGSFYLKKDSETGILRRYNYNMHSGSVPLRDIFRNHLSIMLIEAFSQVDALMPSSRGESALTTPNSLEGYQDQYSWAIQMAKNDPRKAHQSAWNLDFLCAALYLDNWDWTTGLNRDFKEIYPRF